MPYTVGVSSGWWKIDRPPDLLGLATKVGSFGGTAGVQFIQADLDTTSEFFEPRLKEQINRIRHKMGMDFGLHAEVGELMALESAERRLWDQSHIRLVETVKYSAELGMKYINIHLSNKPQLLFLEAQYRVTGYFYPVVSYDGRPIWTICEENEKVKEAAKKHIRGVERVVFDDNQDGYEKILEWQSSIEEREVRKELDELESSPEYETAKGSGDLSLQRVLQAQATERGKGNARSIVNRELPDQVYYAWKESVNARYNLDTAEIAAYTIVARYMKETGDPLWSNICKNGDVERTYVDHHAEFNAALAAKYLEGHLTVKNNEYNKKYLNGMSVLEWLEKHKIILALEIPEAHEGYEGLLRLIDPLQGHVLIRKLRSPILKLCIDFEHMLSHKLNVENMINKLPSGGGKDIIALHVGKPIPYFGSAHTPIPIGSRAQEIVYQWIFALRKKGFRDGYIIYERGGGKTAWDVMQNVVWVMRQMVKYLEQDVPFDKLPPEFYGISEQTKETFARQLVTVRDHAWDPLEGVLEIPEEKHTFLSKVAVEKGKREEWEKRKLR